MQIGVSFGFRESRNTREAVCGSLKFRVSVWKVRVMLWELRHYRRKGCFFRHGGMPSGMLEGGYGVGSEGEEKVW